jgi:ferredoxin
MTAATVFDQDEEDGRVIVLAHHPSAEQAGAARKAVALCPSGALSLKETADEPR